MKLISWNVNGIRAAAEKGFLNWFEKEDADVVCIQETKATSDQLDFFLREPGGYFSVWKSAEKPGYSGVAIFTRKEPVQVIDQMGIEEFDNEGRFLRVDFKNFTVINCYFPNSQREHTRLDYKLRFCESIQRYTSELVKQGKHVVLCGDYNVAHREIDLANPKSNQKNAGFLPEERAWMDRFLAGDFVDIFRKLNPNPHQYTWWSYRPGVRAKNIGWRIDYHCVSQSLVDRTIQSYLQPEVMGSDHCPVGLILKN